MDLFVVEDAAAKRRAQKAVETSVKMALRSQGVWNIGFPSGNRDEKVYATVDRGLWCAFGDAGDAKIPRRWNVYGVFDESRRTQNITVEINIPTTSNSASVAGFFATNPSTGATYLMHDGSVGGGKRGVGRESFLAWSRRELLDVMAADGKVREGILVGRVDSPALADRLWVYVRTVRAFKDAVGQGALDDEDFRRQVEDWDEYRRESSGHRTGTRTKEIDYVSYHGDIVDVLKAEIEARRLPGQRVLNTRLVDLYVKAGSTVTEVYEIKTSLQRQSLYTGIGQLMTHGLYPTHGVKRVLVCPVGQLTNDIGSCCERLGIVVRQFHLTKGDSPKVVFGPS